MLSNRTRVLPGDVNQRKADFWLLLQSKGKHHTQHEKYRYAEYKWMTKAYVHGKQTLEEDNGCGDATVPGRATIKLFDVGCPPASLRL